MFLVCHVICKYNSFKFSGNPLSRPSGLSSTCATSADGLSAIAIGDDGLSAIAIGEIMMVSLNNELAVATR